MRAPWMLLSAVLTFASSIAWSGETGIVGRLLDPEGIPVAGATVEALAHESAEQTGERRVAGRTRTPLGAAKSAADGSFRIASKQPFAWVQATAEGHVPAIAAATGGPPLLITLRRAPLARGIVTARGRPVSGAVVIWYSGDGAEVHARTGADGAFAAPDPARAPGQLTVLHPDHAPHRAFVAAEGAAHRLDQKLEAGIALRGSVIDERSRKPVAGAGVWIDETWPLARTDAAGAFHIPHAPRDWTTVTARTRDAIGTARHRTAPILIALTPSRTLSGAIVDAATRRPLAGATVVVKTPAGAMLTAETDVRGEYTLTGLPAGGYQPYAHRPGYAPGPARSHQSPRLDLRRTLRARFDAALTRLPHVEGRAVDEERRPVEGALVALGINDTPHLYSATWSFGEVPFVGGGHTRTGSDGTFTLALPAEEESEGAPAFLVKDRPLIVLKQGFAAARIALESRTPKAPPVLVTLSRGVPLHGRVTGPEGRPVAGVAVSAAEDGSVGGSLMPTHAMLASLKDEGWTRTDEAGRFAIRVHPSVHHVALRKTGYAPRLVRSHDPRAGQPLDVVLEPAAAVRGRVSRPDGRGVPDVQIHLASPLPMPGATPGTAVTSADGAFEIGDLEAGVYQLIAQSDELGIGESRTVEAPEADLQIVLAPAVTLRGQVLAAATRQPVPRFGIAVWSESDGRSSSRSLDADDVDGSFTLPDVSVGDATLTVTAEGYVSKEVEGVTLEAGVDPPPVEILLDDDAPIRGRVTNDTGGPVADARVSVVEAEDAQVAQASADEDGEYELRGLTAGEVTLSFWAQGFAPEHRTVDTRQSSRLDVTLKRGLSLRGEVVQASGGVPNVNVSARSSAQGVGYQSAQTDERGRFTIEGLVPGRYTVAAAARGKGSAKVEDVDAETAGPLRLVLEPAATAVLTGRVIGLPEGDDAGMAMVMAANEESGASGHASLDASRSFRMEDAPAGRVKVRAFASSLADGGTRMSRTVELELAPASETETVLEFPNDVTISGTVVRDGAGVPYVMVAFSGGVDQASAARTDERGAYQAVGLEPGRYQVQVSGDNVSFATQYVVTGSAEFDIDITGGSIAGRVVRADDGAPVPGVEVSFFRIGLDENTPVGSATTGGQGAYMQRSLAEGPYRLITSKAGFGQEVRDVEVARGAAAEVVLELTPADGVGVTVVDARDQRPLDAIVVVRDPARRIVANRHSGVGDDGALNIPLADGSYILSTSATGYGTVTIPVRAPAQGLRIGLTPGGTLVIESARLLRGRVRLVQPDGEEYVRCWCNGIAEIQLKGRRTRVENVTPGSYTVELLDQPEGVPPQPVVIHEGRTSTLNVD